jgi:putative transposase
MSSSSSFPPSSPAISSSSAAGARLWYLPPYSPDLNPIEQTFAKIKHWMRTAQKPTVQDTGRYIGRRLATIKPSECNNYFANSGYTSDKRETI